MQLRSKQPRTYFITSFSESLSIEGPEFTGLFAGLETSGMGYEMTSRRIDYFFEIMNLLELVIGAQECWRMRQISKWKNLREMKFDAGGICLHGCRIGETALICIHKSSLRTP